MSVVPTLIFMTKLVFWLLSPYISLHLIQNKIKISLEAIYNTADNINSDEISNKSPKNENFLCL